VLGIAGRQGRAALAAVVLGVAIAATSASTSGAVTVPALPLETPQVPSTPTVPDLPTAPTLSAPQVGTPDAPSAPRLRPAPSPSLGGGAPGGSSSGPSGDQAPSSDGAAPAARGGSQDAPASSVGQGAAGSAPRRSTRALARRVRMEQHFRRSARGLEPCFFTVSGFGRRVIALRAGFAGRQPLGRGRVARQLGASLSSVRRAERSALRTMGTARRTHGCLETSSAGGQVLAAVAATPVESGGAPPLIQPTASGAAQLVSAQTSQARIVTAGAPGSPPPGMPGIPGLEAAEPGAGSLPPGLSGARPVSDTSGGPPLGLALALIPLALITMAVSTAVLARRRTGGRARVAETGASSAETGTPPRRPAHLRLRRHPRLPSRAPPKALPWASA
jgi:hypothetical protein